METRECTYDQAKAHAQRNGLEFRPHNGMMLTNEEFQKQAETQMIFGGYAYGKF